MVCELVFTAAMSISIFNTPRLVAVSLPRSGSPLPLITQNSALVVLLPAATSHENVPITSNGVWDAYAKSFLSERADLHFTLFLFSHSHVCLSMMLVLAPESIIILSLHPPMMTSIFSCFLSPTVNAYSGSSSSSCISTIFAEPLLGSLCHLVFLFPPSRLCFVLQRSWKCPSNPHLRQD